MKPRSVVPSPVRPVIDTAEFVRTSGELASESPVSGFPRLLELLAGESGVVRWQLSGERRPRAEGGTDGFLVLHFSGEAELGCIRCLQPVPVAFSDQRLFKLAATEALAEREDAQTDDYDMLVGDSRFDVLEFIEDEAILALPIAPCHGHCNLPANVAEPAAPPVERLNPFAGLAALRNSRPVGDKEES